MALCFRLVPGAAQYCLAAVAEGRLLVQWLADAELRPSAPPCQLPLPSCGLLRAASIVRGSGTDEHVYLLLMQSYRISGFRLYPPCPAHPVGRVAPDGVFLPELCLTCLDVTRETVYLGTSVGLVMMVEHEHATLQWAGHVTCCRPRSLAPTPTPGAVWLPSPGPARITLSSNSAQATAPIPIREVRVLDHPQPDHIPLMVAVLYADGRLLVSVGNAFTSCILRQLPIMKLPFMAVEWLLWQNDAFLVLQTGDARSPLWKVKVARWGQEPQLEGAGALAVSHTDIQLIRRDEAGLVTWCRLWVLRASGELRLHTKAVTRIKEGGATSLGQLSPASEGPILDLMSAQGAVAVLLADKALVARASSGGDISAAQLEFHFTADIPPAVEVPWAAPEDESDEESVGEQMEVDRELLMASLDFTSEPKRQRLDPDADESVGPHAAPIPCISWPHFPPAAAISSTAAAPSEAPWAVPSVAQSAPRPSPYALREDDDDDDFPAPPPPPPPPPPLAPPTPNLSDRQGSTAPTAWSSLEKTKASSSVAPSPRADLAAPQLSLVPAVATGASPNRGAASGRLVFIPPGQLPPLSSVREGDRPPPQPPQPQPRPPSHLPVSPSPPPRASSSRPIWPQDRQMRQSPPAKPAPPPFQPGRPSAPAVPTAATPSPSSSSSRPAPAFAFATALRRELHARPGPRPPAPGLRTSGCPPLRPSAPPPATHEVIDLDDDDDDDDKPGSGSGTGSGSGGGGDGGCTAAPPAAPPALQPPAPRPAMSPRPPGTPPSTPPWQPAPPPSPPAVPSTPAADPLALALQPVDSAAALKDEECLFPLRELPSRAARAAAKARLQDQAPRGRKLKPSWVVRVRGLRDRPAQRREAKPLPTAIDPQAVCRQPPPKKMFAFLYCDPAHQAAFHECQYHGLRNPRVQVAVIKEGPLTGQRGCFAAQPMRAGEPIGLYSGVVELVEAAQNEDSLYIAALPSRGRYELHVDAGEWRNEMAFANDFRQLGEQNAEFVVGKAVDFDSTGLPVNVLKACRTIKPGEEILTAYGQGYWDEVAKREHPSLDDGDDDPFPRSCKFTSVLIWSGLRPAVLRNISRSCRMRDVELAPFHLGPTGDTGFVAVAKGRIERGSKLGFLGGEALFADRAPKPGEVVYHVDGMRPLRGVVADNECRYFLPAQDPNAEFRASHDAYGHLHFAVYSRRVILKEEPLTMARYTKLAPPTSL